jgi:hypothetical protein
MKLSSCYLEHLDCFGLRYENRLKSWVGGYTLDICKPITQVNYRDITILYKPEDKGQNIVYFKLINLIKTLTTLISRKKLFKCFR